MIETITTLSVALAAIAEADHYEALGGRRARAKILVTLPARLVIMATVGRVVSTIVARILGREPDANAARVAGIWAGELALRGLSGPLAPILIQPTWPRGIGNAGALGLSAGGFVFITAPVAQLDDAALRATLRHELAHLSLGHVVIRGLGLGLLAAGLPPLVRSLQRHLVPDLPPVIAEVVSVTGMMTAAASLSRRMESAADEAVITEGSADGLARGLAILTAHNEAHAASGFFGKLHRGLSGSDPGRTLLATNRALDHLFGSHPPVATRIAFAVAAAGEV